MQFMTPVVMLVCGQPVYETNSWVRAFFKRSIRKVTLLAFAIARLSWVPPSWAILASWQAKPQFCDAAAGCFEGAVYVMRLLMSVRVAPMPIDGESSVRKYQLMLGAAATCDVAEPLIGHATLLTPFPSTLGKLFRAAEVYETETVRESPVSVTVIVGVGAPFCRPGARAFAVDMKMALAVAAATVSLCINMAGLTAAMAAASAAASNCSFFRSAWVKSSVMPSRKMIGIIMSAKITATFAL